MGIFTLSIPIPFLLPLLYLLLFVLLTGAAFGSQTALFALAAAAGILVLAGPFTPFPQLFRSASVHTEPLQAFALTAFLVITGFLALLVSRSYSSLNQVLDRYHLIDENCRDLILRLDRNLTVRYASSAAPLISGFAPNEWVGEPLARFFSEDPDLAGVLLESDHRPDDTPVEAYLVHRNGQIIPVEIYSRPISRNPGLSGYQVRIHDVTRLADNRIMADDLKTRLQRAEKMEEQGILSGGVAHDLNNILSGIATYPEILLLDESLPETVRSGLKTIRDSGRKAADIVSDLLTLSRGPSAEVEVININAVIDNYLDSPEFEKLIEDFPDVNVVTKVSPDLMNIRSSYIHIEKSLMNLVTNAVEEVTTKTDPLVTIATANRSIPVPMKGYEEIQPGEYSVLSVSDNGSGISRDDLDKIFEPYYSKKEMGRSGTGLGLTIVRNTVHNHGGFIDIISNRQGTWIGLFFPAVKGPVPTRQKQEKTDLETLKGAAEPILVVDDIPAQRDIACSILTHLGYTPHAAASGEEALALVKKQDVQLVILDMIMYPGMSGLETFQELIRIKPGIKAVIASGHAKTDDVKKAQKLGAGRFLKKPYSVAEIAAAIKEELGA